LLKTPTRKRPSEFVPERRAVLAGMPLSLNTMCKKQASDLEESTDKRIDERTERIQEKVFARVSNRLRKVPMLMETTALLLLVMVLKKALTIRRELGSGSKITSQKYY
jgi:hypothetical protein